MRRAVEVLGPVVVAAFLAATATAGVRADFDDDGFDDLAIGVEGEDLPAPDSVVNAGAVNVIYGSSTGLNPETPPGDQFWHENVEGVSGAAESDGGFGDAVAAGDFDGDGHADLAIGASGDSIRGAEYAGSIRVLYGANNGLTADGDDLINEATEGVPGSPAADDELGTVMAAGDFDADGRDDLATSVYCQRVAGEECAGAVLVLYGSPGGLRATGADVFSEKTNGIAGAPKAFDKFGGALAAGDLEGAGPDDLAIGASDDDIAGAQQAGTVRVLFGTPGGLTAKGDRRIHADQGDVGGPGEAVANEFFGSSLAAGQIGGSKADELAVGTPEDDDATGGSVSVLRGAGSGPSVQDVQFFSQGTPDVLGVPQDGDLFGWSLAIGNFDDQPRGDLAVGVREDADAGPDSSGSVNVLYGDGAGITTEDDQLIHQAVVFVEGTAEQNDGMGAALASGDFDSAGGQDLAITVAADTAGAVDDAGSVQVFYGASPFGLDPATDILFHQGLPEIQNEPTENEFFGDSLAAGW